MVEDPFDGGPSMTFTSALRGDADVADVQVGFVVVQWAEPDPADTLATADDGLEAVAAHQNPVGQESLAQFIAHLLDASVNNFVAIAFLWTNYTPLLYTFGGGKTPSLYTSPVYGYTSNSKVDILSNQISFSASATNRSALFTSIAFRLDSAIPFSLAEMNIQNNNITSFASYGGGENVVAQTPSVYDYSVAPTSIFAQQTFLSGDGGFFFIHLKSDATVTYSGLNITENNFF